MRAYPSLLRAGSHVSGQLTACDSLVWLGKRGQASRQVDMQAQAGHCAELASLSHRRLHLTARRATERPLTSVECGQYANANDMPGPQLPHRALNQRWHPWSTYMGGGGPYSWPRRGHEHGGVATLEMTWRPAPICKGEATHSWPMRWRRIGEADMPGPPSTAMGEPVHTRRVRGKSSPPFHRSDTTASSSSSVSDSSSSMTPSEPAQGNPASTDHHNPPEPESAPVQDPCVGLPVFTSSQHKTLQKGRGIVGGEVCLPDGRPRD